MEHEQVNERAVALAARGAKMTARMLAQAMLAFLRQDRQGTDCRQIKRRVANRASAN